MLQIKGYSGAKQMGFDTRQAAQQYLDSSRAPSAPASVTRTPVVSTPVIPTPAIPTRDTPEVVYLTLEDEDLEDASDSDEQPREPCWRQEMSTHRHRRRKRGRWKEEEEHQVCEASDSYEEEQVKADGEGHGTTSVQEPKYASKLSGKTYRARMLLEEVTEASHGENPLISEYTGEKILIELGTASREFAQEIIPAYEGDGVTVKFVNRDEAQRGFERFWSAASLEREPQESDVGGESFGGGCIGLPTPEATQEEQNFGIRCIAYGACDESENYLRGYTDFGRPRRDDERGREGRGREGGYYGWNARLRLIERESERMRIYGRSFRDGRVAYGTSGEREANGEPRPYCMMD